MEPVKKILYDARSWRSVVDDDIDPILSVLIPTVVGREELYRRLYDEVRRQANLEIPRGRCVEIVTILDDKEISIGEKRNALLEYAQGEYVAFVDDDDWISEDYLRRIIDVLERDRPEAVGIWIDCHGTPKRLGHASARYRRWSETGRYYERSIYHKNPIRRDIALEAGFPDLRFAEDAEFSRRLLRLVKKSSDLELPPVYVYRYRPEPRAEKYGFNRDEPNP